MVELDGEDLTVARIRREEEGLATLPAGIRINKAVPTFTLSFRRFLADKLEGLLGASIWSTSTLLLSANDFGDPRCHVAP